jgi:dipeptidyl aminopeptidase/acylaminoacyl peptidase
LAQNRYLRSFVQTASMAVIVLYSRSVAYAQEKPPAVVEGKLDKFINPDAEDTATKLEVLQQAIYQEQQTATLLLFTNQYGHRIRTETVQYPSVDGPLIPGYIFTSTNLDRNKKNPAAVIVHGGFHDCFNWQFFNMIDAVVSAGYVVFFPEYRGSRGYGESHYKNDYGVTDVADVLSGADYLSQQSYVDANRLGIIGHSRGGMVTLLAIERAPRKFKVAVDIAGLTDFLAYMAYKPDYRRSEVAKEEHFKGKLPFENLAAYLDVSPLNNVDAIQSPLLVMATTGDNIVPLSLHSGRLVDALKARAKVYDYHVYEKAPGGHVFIFGNSEEQRDCFRRANAWLDKYLK